jgi:hypothetical protein
MNCLTTAEALLWCADRDIPIKNGLPLIPAGCNTFKIPSDAGERIALIKSHWGSLPTQQVLIWVTAWSVWSSCEHMPLFSRFRLAYNETRSLKDAPAHLFSAEEAGDSLSLAILGVMFLWDFYVITPQNNFFSFYSHDEYGSNNQTYPSE